MRFACVTYIKWVCVMRGGDVLRGGGVLTEGILRECVASRATRKCVLPV